MTTCRLFLLCVALCFGTACATVETALFPRDSDLDTSEGTQTGSDTQSHGDGNTAANTDTQTHADSQSHSEMNTDSSSDSSPDTGTETGAETLSDSGSATIEDTNAITDSESVSGTSTGTGSETSTDGCAALLMSMDNDFDNDDGGYLEKIEVPGTGALNKRWIWAGGVGSGSSSIPRDSAAHGKFWGINNGLSEWYANCDNAFLVSPARDLGTCSGRITVAFDTWYQYHSGADGFLVEFWNGSGWHQVAPMEGWGAESLLGSGCSPAPYIHGKPGFDKGCTSATSCTAWQTKHFVLACDPCPSNFQVRFVHGADSGYSTYGAHIDNLRFRKGVYYRGAFWYFGEQGQSCAAVCAQRGGYSDGTRAVSGSAGGDEQCQALLDALGAPAGFLGSGYPLDPGVGCVYVTSLGQRHRDAAFTTETASCSACQRVCACND